MEYSLVLKQSELEGTEEHIEATSFEDWKVSLYLNHINDILPIDWSLYCIKNSFEANKARIRSFIAIRPIDK